MNSNIVRAWKDDFYRQSLSDEERALLPENPVGELELTDAELEGVFGGTGIAPLSIRDEPCRNNSFYVGCHSYLVRDRVCIQPNYTINYGNCYSHYPCQLSSHLVHCPPITIKIQNTR